MGNTSEYAQDLVANAKGATVQINTLTKASKAAGIAMKALATAGNMLAMIAIAKGIELAAKAIDNFVHSTQKAKEATEGARQKTPCRVHYN